MKKVALPWSPSNNWSWTHLQDGVCVREVVKKNYGYFTVRLTVRRGGSQRPLAWPQAFVKNLAPFPHWIWFLDTQNTCYLMVKGLKNAYLMHFSSSHSWFRCSVCYYLQCLSSLNQRVNQRVKKTFFFQNKLTYFDLFYHFIMGKLAQKFHICLRSAVLWFFLRGIFDFCLWLYLSWSKFWPKKSFLTLWLSEDEHCK